MERTDRKAIDPGRLLRRARELADLTQRELAARAGTAQSVVARVETGRTSPTVGTLTRLLAATGFTLEARLVPREAAESHMLEDVPRILRLSPEERLREVGKLSRFLAETRRA